MKRSAHIVNVRKAGKRELQFTASTSDVARDGGIIQADAWRLKNFQRNPVFLWAHQYDQPPVGKVVRVWNEGGELKIRVVFAGEAEGHPFADTVYKLYRGGFLNSVSVGFDVHEERKPTSEERAAGARWVATDAELLEASSVPVPADAGALAEGRIRSAGLNRRDARLMRGWAIESWRALARRIEAMKRELQAVEGGFVAVIREEEFEAGDQVTYQEDPPVLAAVGQLNDEVVIKALKFPGESWSEEDAAAWLEENEAAALEWRGEAEETEEGGDDVEADEEKGRDADAIREAVGEVKAHLAAAIAVLDRLDGTEEDEDEDEEDDEERALAIVKTELDGLRRELEQMRETVTGGEGGTSPDPDPEAGVRELLESAKSYGGK